jgi:hypothetical protein
MTKLEVHQIREVLLKIKEPDGKVHFAIQICNKQLAYYDSMKGQLREQYDFESMGR